MIRHHLAIAGRYAAAHAARSLMIVGLGVGLGVALAGCETAQEQTGGIWSTYRQRHPISIVEKDRTLNIFVGSARNGLTPAQRADVLDFAQSWRSEGTSRFVIDQPSAARNAHAAALALREIRSILAASGVPPQAVKVQSYRPAGRNTLAVIRVNYPRVVAQAGPCGHWPDNLGPGEDPNHIENIEYWNYGCATQRNLAAMVANPTDLVQPRAEAPVNAGRRTIVLDKYRKGESTATTYSNPDKGVISDIGK
jgi:pilus assembly protein CpaD